MRSPTEIGRERDMLATVAELTGAFEGIASMHIAQIKDQVLKSQVFFSELWGIYSQIRVGEKFHFGRGAAADTNPKELIVLVTAEGSFSGDLDRQVVNAVQEIYNSKDNDILVVGTHGAAQLEQNKIAYIRSFKLPVSDHYINVMPLVAEVQKYKSTTVYYPSYISLTNQQVKSIKMSAFVAERGKDASETQSAAKEGVISEGDYIFEPSTFAVVDHLERSMLVIMLGEIILESKLAQYASRFRAMNTAKDKANESYAAAVTDYNRTKRLIKDERAKEITNGLRKAQV